MDLRVTSMAPRKKPREDEGDVGVVTETRVKPKLQKPKLYKVILHNDNYTTMEFVVSILIGVFHKSESDAMAIMLNVHNRGAGVAGVYTYEVAEAKVEKTMGLAREAQYPLLCTMEPDELGGDKEE
jgi:ATP-dependent Clp protease adaptor protein ClpS